MYGENDYRSCIRSMQPLPPASSGIKHQIFGAALLKHYFAFFDGGNMRVGMAEKN